MAGLGEYRWRRDVLQERIQALEGRRRGAARHRIQLTLSVSMDVGGAG